MTGKTLKSCFVISPIGKEGSKIRENADHLFSYILKPVLNELNYEPARADMLPVPGMINPYIIKQIIEADLTIADLTGMNPNVFYELAIRHVIGKPYIHMIKEGEDIPFDVKDIHTITYSMHIESVEKAKNKLREQVKYFDSGATVISPFTMTLDILESQRTETPQKLEDINTKIDALNEVITSISKSNSTIHDPFQSGMTESLKKLEKLEENIRTTISNMLDEKLKKFNNTSSNNSSNNKDNTPTVYIPSGLAKRATPNTYSISEWLESETKDKR